MNTTILIVYLFISRSEIAIQYAQKFDTPEKCAAMQKVVDRKNEKMRNNILIPYGKWVYSECVLEVKGQ